MQKKVLTLKPVTCSKPSELVMPEMRIVLGLGLRYLLTNAFRDLLATRAPADPSELIRTPEKVAFLQWCWFACGLCG